VYFGGSTGFSFGIGSFSHPAIIIIASKAARILFFTVKFLFSGQK